MSVEVKTLQELANMSQIGKTGLWGKVTGYQYEFFMCWILDNTNKFEIDIKWNKNYCNPINITDSQARFVDGDGNNLDIVNVPFAHASFILGLLIPLMDYKRIYRCGCLKPCVTPITGITIVTGQGASFGMKANGAVIATH